MAEPDDLSRLNAERAARHERFRQAIEMAKADTDNTAPPDIVYPLHVEFRVYDGSRVGIFDANGKACIPGFLDDPDVAVALVNWINMLAEKSRG